MDITKFGDNRTMLEFPFHPEKEVSPINNLTLNDFIEFILKHMVY
jgi:hypothetical protein